MRRRKNEETDGGQKRNKTKMMEKQTESEHGTRGHEEKQENNKRRPEYKDTKAKRKIKPRDKGGKQK